VQQGQIAYSGGVKAGYGYFAKIAAQQSMPLDSGVNLKVRTVEAVLIVTSHRHSPG
jgi:hypothetical protein